MKERCRETLEKAYLFLDGEVLSEAERYEMKRHLEDCGPCYERVGVDGEVSTIVARLRGSQLCPDGLRARIASLLEETR